MTPPAGPVSAYASPAEAVAAMLERVRAVGTERIGLRDASGRVLAEAVRADRPSPAADVSAMDGYAMRVRDVAAGRHAVAGEVRIGREPPPLAGRVLRIVTGAPVPAGADAVVKREDVRELGDAIEIDAGVLAALRPGANIRRRGENIGAGDEVIGAGSVIGPASSAAMACFGVREPLVHRRVRVGILVTGDEVLAAGADPSPWELRDSNGAALRSLIGACAWAEAVGPRRAEDEPGPLRGAIESLLSECDALIVTGGVSMGDRDFVPAALEAAGVEVLFHRIPQRPGKPVLGGITRGGERGGQPVLGLPGNPVSVLVTARRMAGPVLAKAAGGAEPPPPLVKLESQWGKRLGLWWHRPVRLSGPGRAVLVEGKGSGDIVSASRSDGFIEVPPGEGGPGPWPFYGWAL